MSKAVSDVPNISRQGGDRVCAGVRGGLCVGDPMALADHVGSPQTQDVRDALDVERRPQGQAVPSQGDSETVWQGPAESEASHGGSRRRRQPELRAMESQLGNPIAEPEDGSTADTSSRIDDRATTVLTTGGLSVDDIKALRERYCDHFIKTGELDQPMLAQLTAFAVSMRGQPKPQRTRNDGEQDRRPKKIVMPSLRPPGRQKGSRIMIIDGVRRLVTPEKLERMRREASAAENKIDAPALG